MRLLDCLRFASFLLLASVRGLGNVTGADKMVLECVATRQQLEVEEDRGTQIGLNLDLAMTSVGIWREQTFWEIVVMVREQSEGILMALKLDLAITSGE